MRRGTGGHLCGRGVGPSQPLTPRYLSPCSAGHQADLRHLHQPCDLARPRSHAGEPRWARASPWGPADVLPARGRPRTWLGAEDSRALAVPAGQPGQAVGDRRRMRGRVSFRPPPEPASWTKAPPGPKAQGLRLQGPQPWFSLPRFCLVSIPVFIFSSLSVLSLCSVSVCFLVSSPFFLPLPFLLSRLSTGLSPLLHFCFLSSAFLSRLCSFPCHLFSSHQNQHVAKEKKGKKKKKTSKHKKAKTKTNLECVAKCGVLLVASVCVPVATARPPAPARLPCVPPACPPAPPADDTEFSAWVFGDGS